MESRQSYWVQLLPVPQEERRRFMSVLAEVVLLRNFRGEIKINTPGNKQLQDDDQKTSEVWNKKIVSMGANSLQKR